MIAFVPLTEDALDQVLRWRTDPDITRYLLTDVRYDPARQREWFARVSNDPGCEHWLIRRDDRRLGLASLTEIDRTSRSCSCGFYLGDKNAQHLGGMVLAAIVNHVFGTMDFHKIHGVVMAGNVNVLRIHELLGYRQVGVMRDHVFKYGAYHDLHIFELLRADWEANQAAFRPFRIPFLVDEGDPR